MRRSALAMVVLAGLAAPPAVGAATRDVVADGAWSWFGDPRAVHHEGAHRRTYVGYVTSQGDVAVSSYDRDTEEVATGVLAPRFEVDDHDNPSLLVRPDGRLTAFWSAHQGDQMHYRTTLAPEDVRAWGETRLVPTTARAAAGTPIRTRSACAGRQTASTSSGAGPTGSPRTRRPRTRPRRGLPRGR